MPLYTRTTPAALLNVTGEDAADFLHSQASQDLRGAAPWCRYSLWLDARGRLQADSVVLRRGEEHFQLLSHGVGEDVLRAHLERHIVADEVELAAQGKAWRLITLWDPAGRGASDMPEGLADSPPVAAAWPSPRLPGAWELLVPAVAVDSAAQALASAGYTAAEAAVFTAARIRAGRPEVGTEVGAGETPGEVGLMDAVCLTKGCYVGQEVVNRMARLERRTRQLLPVELSQDPGTTPVPLESAGAAAGELRSAVPSENPGEAWIGLALVRTKALEAGTPLTTPQGVMATPLGHSDSGHSA